MRLRVLPFLRVAAVLAALFAAVAVPTTCQCGAELPHPHSLFDLPGHHHYLGGHTHQATTPLSDETDELSIVPWSIPLPSGSSLVWVGISFSLLALSSSRPRVSWRTVHLPTGHFVSPPAPPPRFLALTR